MTQYISETDLAEFKLAREKVDDIPLLLTAIGYNEMEVFEAFKAKWRVVCDARGIDYYKTGKKILCLFAMGYWGANANPRSSQKGIKIIVEDQKKAKVSLDLVDVFELKKNPDVGELSAARLAALGLHIAYDERESILHKTSPCWQKTASVWKQQDDLQYVFVDGYKLPLKIKQMSAEAKYRCVAVNMAFAMIAVSRNRTGDRVETKTREILEGVARSFQQVVSLAGIDSEEVIKYYNANSTQAVVGGTAIESFMLGKSAVPMRASIETAEGQAQVAQAQLARLLAMAGVGQAGIPSISGMKGEKEK